MAAYMLVTLAFVGVAVPVVGWTGYGILMSLSPMAGIAAATFWVLGIGSRLAFEEYSSHGGAGAIANFSISHQITSQDAWVAALVLMALADVVSRLVVISLRGSKLSRSETKDTLVLSGSAAAA